MRVAILQTHVFGWTPDKYLRQARWLDLIGIQIFGLKNFWIEVLFVDWFSGAWGALSPLVILIENNQTFSPSKIWLHVQILNELCNYNLMDIRTNLKCSYVVKFSCSRTCFNFIHVYVNLHKVSSWKKHAPKTVDFNLE